MRLFQLFYRAIFVSLFICVALVTAQSDTLQARGDTVEQAVQSSQNASQSLNFDEDFSTLKEDSLLKLLDDIDADIKELREVEAQVYQAVEDDTPENQMNSNLLEGELDNLRDYEIQMLNQLGLNSGSLDMQIMQVENNINSLEQEKRDLIEQLIKEKIKINKDLPFLEREVNTSSRMQMLKYENYLERFPNSEFADNIYFRLADFYYRTANEQYEKDMERYEVDFNEFELAESLFDAGILPSQPEEPIFPEKKFDKARLMCRRIINEFPESDVRDDALFNIGFFYEEEMNRGDALPFYQKLVAEFPSSRYVPEAHLRIGEYYFDNPDADSGTGLDKAILSYKSIMKFWSHPNFALAIYKLGWTYYRLFDYANAISYFIFLLDDSRTIKDAQINTFKVAYDLDAEALRYVAMSFKENVPEEQLFSPEPWAGVPEKTSQFISKLVDKNYAPIILEELGAIYKEVDQSIGAIESYQALLGQFPYYQNAHLIQKQIIDLYDALGTDPEIAKKYGNDWAINKANDARLVLFETYGKAWADTIQDTEKREKVVKMAKDAIYYVAVHNFDKAQKSKAKEDYRHAIELFRNFLKDFPKGEQAYDIRWIIASILDTELKQFEEALGEYLHVSQDRMFDKYREEAATNAIALTQDMMKTEIAGMIGDSLALKEVHPAEKKYMLAIDNFIRLLPEHADVPIMLNNKALLYYNKDKFDEAKIVYDKLIKLYPKRDESIEALKLIASAYLKRGHYERAIDWYKRWRDTSEKGEDKLFANDLIAQCLRSIATRHQKAGQHREAAKAFERVVEEQPNYKFAPQTLFEAAKEYEAVKDFRKASVIYQQVVMNYPSVKDAPAALWNASLAYDKNGDKRQAAQLYEQLAKIYPSYENVSAAIYNAAIKYEELEDWRNAARVFEWFVEKYPEDKENKEFLFTAGKYYGKVGDERKAKDVYSQFSKRFPDDVRVIEIKYDLAMALYKKKNMDAAKERMYDVIEAFNDAGKPADFKGRAAEASFIIAELDYQVYADIKFLLPQNELDINFKKKLKMLSEINDKYADVVRYGIINWAPQSVYKIARNIEEFATTYEQQEIPSDLQGKEEVDRLKKIKLNLTGMLEKAIDPYQVTIDLASKIKGDNTDSLIAPWVIRAKKKKLETVYRIALAKKQAQMAELTFFTPDTSEMGWVKNMKRYKKIAKRLSKLVPDFERVFTVAEDLGIDVINPGVVGEEDVSVPMDEMMRVMMSPTELAQLEATSKDQDIAHKNKKVSSEDSLADTGNMHADSTLVTKVDSNSHEVALADTSTDSLKLDASQQKIAAVESSKVEETFNLNIAKEPEVIAVVNNSKIELSHLLYLMGDLTGQGALEFLSSPIPEQIQKNPMLLTEYSKKIAQQGIKFIQPGIAAFNQGLMTATDYNIKSQWVDKAKVDLLRNSNVGAELFSKLALASVENYNDFSKLYRTLYETGDVTEDGQDAYSVEGLLYQFADYGVLFAKVALQSYQKTLDIGMGNEIADDFLKPTHLNLAKFIYLIGSNYEMASNSSASIAELYSKYAAGDTTQLDSFSTDLDPVVAEDLNFVFQENKDIFYDNSIELYEMGYEMLQDVGAENEWQLKIQNRLAKLLPDLYGEPEELNYFNEHLVSGDDMKCNALFDSMWAGTYCADSAWGAAVKVELPKTIQSIAGFDTSVAHAIWDHTGADSVCFRKIFVVGGIPQKASLLITAKDNYRIFINEVYIAKDDTLDGDWNESKVYDVIDYLYEGENLLAILADKKDSTQYGLVFDLNFSYGVQLQGDSSVQDAQETAIAPVSTEVDVNNAPSQKVAGSMLKESSTDTVGLAGKGDVETTSVIPNSEINKEQNCIERENKAKASIQKELLMMGNVKSTLDTLVHEIDFISHEIDSLKNIGLDDDINSIRDSSEVLKQTSDLKQDELLIPTKVQSEDAP